MIDRLKLYGEQLRPLLGAGESPLVAVTCQVAFGADRLERSPEEVEHLLRFLPATVRDQVLAALRDGQPRDDRDRWRRAMDRAVDILIGADSLITADPDEIIGGVAAAGHVGSYAHRLSAALSGKIGYAVVTDRRLLLASQTPRGEFEELESVPRQAVLSARRAGRIFQRGRVLLDFVDLSQIALMTGILSTGPANRLVSALTTGVVRDAG